MRNSGSDDESRQFRKGCKSNYFQTEFTVSITKKPEDFEIQGDNNIDISNITQSELDSYEEYFAGNYSSNKKKVSISVQADGDIVSCEDLPKERKRWIRPPLEGQASTSNKTPVAIQLEDNNDSEGEIIEGTNSEEIPDTYLTRKEYVNEKPPEGAVLSEPRVPSPASASSLISVKPLEWDSGADVGYLNFYPREANDQQISTLERLALGGLTRSDPEGTPCVKSTVPPPIGPPNAESTPNGSIKHSKNASDSEDRKDYPLFPEVLVKNYEVSDSETEAKEHKESPIKTSASLDNVNDAQGSATFPRCQSKNGVETNPRIRQLAVNKSNSSSSVATVVNKQKTIKNQNHSEPKLLSDTDSAQTAANSFEYLPGDKYEDSGGTLDLKKDVERGVMLLGEFMKGAGANDTISKRQLLKKVVDGLLEKRYPEDEEWEAEVFGEGRCKTRRSQHRDDISGQSTGGEEQSRDSVFSQMEKSAAEGHSASSAYKSSSSVSQDSRKVSRERSEQLTSLNRKSSRDKSEQLPPPPQPSFQAPPQPVFRRNSSLKDRMRVDSKQHKPSSSESARSDWRAPVTRAERVYELEKSKGEISPNGVDPTLFKYINSERENQLEWIKKEINHLSNLKTLLEKHETIKRNFTQLKSMKETKDRPRIRNSETKSLRMPYHKSRRELPKSCSAPLRRNQRVELEVSDQSSWNSHGYESKKGGLIKRNASTNTGISVVTQLAKPPSKPIAYTIVFQPGNDKENDNKSLKDQENLYVQYQRDFMMNNRQENIIADREELQRESRERIKQQLSQLKLQDELITKKPDCVLRAESRRQVVADLTALREIRQQNKDKIIAAALSSDILPTNDIPPNPLEVKRVLSQKEMRHRTEKLYKKTFDVKQKQIEHKRKQEYQTNRLMADLFNRKLQRTVLRGKTDISNSVNVISTY